MDPRCAFSLMLPACALLSACGGGGSGGFGGAIVPGSEIPPGNYQTLSSTNAGSVSQLGGVVLRVNETTGETELVRLTGSFVHDSRAVTLSDGRLSITDPDGPDVNDDITDGVNTAKFVIRPAQYDYVAGVSATYPSGGVNYTNGGFAGVATSAANVPTTGTATYTGTAKMTLINPGVTTIDSANTVVNANFGNARVTANVGGLSSTDQNGNSVTNPFNSLQIANMRISGNQISSSAATVSGVSNLTGANTTSEAAGTFFGYDATISAPDEVSIVFKLEGDAGLITGAIVAD